MKKKVFSMIIMLIILVTGTCHAASYTLQEKMYNQLSIGSGLKGTFSIKAEGEKFRTPFLDAVTDAEWSLRGIQSGSDLHYYVFQTNEQEEQSAFSELYRKEGTYYFKSDMVQGKILSFPVLSQILESLFPAGGENGTSTSFISKIISLPENTRKEKWEPVIQRYQNELEMWLADFTVKADTVKMENNLSALDFSYEIPTESINEETVKILGRIMSDQDATALLDTVMTEEEKKIYLNPNLLYFYAETLQSLRIVQPVRMSKRVSAIGDLIRFRLELPLDENSTGYRSVCIEMIGQLTVITLVKTGETMLVSFMSADKLKQPAFEQSFWYARINSDPEKAKDNKAVRIDVKKTTDSYEKDEKSHETEHYDISILQDTAYLPADTDLSLLTDYDPVTAAVELHYSSKYAQNSATTLEFSADIQQADSRMKIAGKLKTAAPWLFMPFEVNDPVPVGTDREKVLDPYITDWISNAASLVHHTAADAEETSGPAETEQQAEEPAPEEESAPEEEPTGNEDGGQEAETVPLDVQGEE
ncbi:MAG: hypothetical protein IKE15_07435 [Clostridia bacterium]|nr:hypothetical protein [Clostridia bacterium]